MGCFNKYDVGGCGCNLTIEVDGCVAGYSGLTVQIYDHSGGTLLFTGTTDGSGRVAPSLSPGTYYVVITGQSARFDAYGANTGLASGLNQIALTPAAGYCCLGGQSGCNLPVSAFLNYTHGGVATALDGSGNCQQWSGTTSGGVTVTFDHLGTGSEGATPFTWVATTCPTSFLATCSNGATVTE